MSGESTFTEREQKLMSLAWQCFEEQPKVDYEKLAGLAGMTNPRSASNAWAIIKKKLTAQAGKAGDSAEGGEGEATPKAPKTGGKRKKAATEQNGTDKASPSKKAKIPAKIRGGKAQNAEEGAMPVKGEDNSDGEFQLI